MVATNPFVVYVIVVIGDVSGPAPSGSGSVRWVKLPFGSYWRLVKLPSGSVRVSGSLKVLNVACAKASSGRTILVGLPLESKNSRVRRPSGSAESQGKPLASR